jgi:hypothetical protein
MFGDITGADGISPKSRGGHRLGERRHGRRQQSSIVEPAAPHGVVARRDQLCFINQRGLSGCGILLPRQAIGCLSLTLENANLNKQEFIDAVASEVGIAKSAAAETIDAFLATVTSAV